MNEYLIKFDITNRGFFSNETYHGSDIVKGESASDAKKNWEIEFKSEIERTRNSGLILNVTDIVKM